MAVLTLIIRVMMMPPIKNLVHSTVLRPLTPNYNKVKWSRVRFGGHDLT
jgi:hypothetical protein